MRFGKWRGVTLAIATATLLAAGLTSTATAGLFSHTIPRETLAYDIRTGGPAYAPPIPYGEYAKDYVGCITNAVHGAFGRVCSLCGKLGCASCGGLGHHNGKACGSCGGDGCSTCQGPGGHGGKLGGLFHHGHGDPCANGDCGAATTGKRHTLFAGHHGRSSAGSLCGPGQNCATPQAVPAAQTQILPTGQAGAVYPCGQCKGAGCGGCGGVGFLSGHGLFKGGKACGLCGGRGMFKGHACGSCGGAGVDPCGACGGRGCGLCKGGGNGCSKCGGHGCSACLSKVHGILSSLLHKGDIKYFVGPGGPVPLTPGYVPYVVTTRSPRDFFAFPPFVDTLP